MYLWIGLRKSTPPQNRQLNIPIIAALLALHRECLFIHLLDQALLFCWRQGMPATIQQERAREVVREKEREKEIERKRERGREREKEREMQGGRRGGGVAP